MEKANANTYYQQCVNECTPSLYLNCSSFYFSMQVVSTRVGGIPEVLPPHLIILADPNVESL